ncbi:hypothetical protein EDC94DRAFT_585523 [Helicostylum pulchrum]|nr:hypothetical protein EDC94DRAFT_585523 [Helicostylum pulchrum]
MSSSKDRVFQKKIIKEAIAETPKGCLSLKSVFSYNTIKKSYLNFLTEYNLREDNVNRPPLEPFTKWSFNTEMLKQYITYRVLLYSGRVEDRLQLGTIIREIKSLISIAKTESEKIALPESEALGLLRTIIASIKQGLANSGNVNFELQNIFYFLLILFTGVRPSSLTLSVKNEAAPHLQWKHAKISRSGRDTRGFKITATITIPHLKGRGSYFSEAQRTFRKAFVSEVVEDYTYDAETDIVLYICVLAFCKLQRLQCLASPSTKTHWDQHEKDLDPAQSMKRVRQYFLGYFNYEFSDVQVQQLETNRKNNIARGKARRSPPKRKSKSKPTYAIAGSASSSSQPSSSLPSSKRTRLNTPSNNKRTRPDSPDSSHPTTPVRPRRKLRIRSESPDA